MQTRCIIIIIVVVVVVIVIVVIVIVVAAAALPILSRLILKDAELEQHRHELLDQRVVWLPLQDCTRRHRRSAVRTRGRGSIARRYGAGRGRTAF